MICLMVRRGLTKRGWVDECSALLSPNLHLNGQPKYDIGTYATIADGAQSILFECSTPAMPVIGLMDGGSFDAGISHLIPFPSLLDLEISICCSHFHNSPIVLSFSIPIFPLPLFKPMDSDLELIHHYVCWNSGPTLSPHTNPLPSPLALRRCRPRRRGCWANHGLCIHQHRWTYLAKHQSIPRTYRREARGRRSTRVEQFSLEAKYSTSSSGSMWT